MESSAHRNGRPLVTVLMAVWNRQAFVGQAIESILLQTLSDFEFIIVDDGSTDRSGEILTRYASQDSRIVILSSRRNEGVASSLNLAIGRARGEYLAVMDSDDIASPERLQTQVGFLEKCPDFAFVGSHARLMTLAGRRFARRLTCRRVTKISTTPLSVAAGP